MKRLISTFIILIILAIGCLPATMANFVMPDEMKMNKNMQNETTMSDCCDSMSSNCNDNNHDCCFSPFKDSSNITSANFSKKQDKKIKGKKNSLDILALVQESAEHNYIQKLTSPPSNYNLEKEANIYITLIGIIKSNC